MSGKPQAALFGQLMTRLCNLKLASSPLVMRSTVNAALADSGMPPLDEEVSLAGMTVEQLKAVLGALPPKLEEVGGAA